jgi:hypothetical protein
MSLSVDFLFKVFKHSNYTYTNSTLSSIWELLATNIHANNASLLYWIESGTISSNFHVTSLIFAY